MSKWKANKIGLVDFWYYDEQEFYFDNGHMLLRGANGSGKSVTMQSAVPLLLDGNMRPERLDPFGSRDRKMSSYLLEENDEREERTGYLYMEFKREDSEACLTVGIGIRARKNKALETWYFALNDGRRVNVDFWLYEKTDVKITLSKKQLINRIGSGGLVMDSQEEYMTFVNQNVFGFESNESYKEMIDLLIQLRTPKLSKDFKPSVINEILSNSLQPLSEEDLRPMSEAIENMDNLSTNLQNYKTSKTAADKISKAYTRYNQAKLYEKSKKYLEKEEECKKLQLLIKENEESVLRNNEEIIVLQKELDELQVEKETLEKEKESLASSEVLYLKKQADDLEKEVSENENNIREKEKQIEEKKEKLIQLEHRIKSETEEKEARKEEIENCLVRMQEFTESSGFEEHDFMQQELKEELEGEYNFHPLIAMVKDFLNDLGTGIGILQGIDELLRKIDEKQMEYDNYRKDSDRLEKEEIQHQAVVIEEKNALKEEVYAGNAKNEELKIPQEMLREIAGFIESYELDRDYHEVLDKIGELYFRYAAKISEEKSGLVTEQNVIQSILEETRAELNEWKEQKEPEPERSEAVCKNRKMLQEKNIPYHEFYKVVDFGRNLTKEQADSLEESLLLMGILDAVIIDPEWKKTVLSLDKGLCDRYIFTDLPKAQDNLLELMEIQGEDDIFFRQRIISVLNSIGMQNSWNTYISKEGTYGIGILTGKITGEYEARYIGGKARERHRQQQIALLEKKCGGLEAQCNEINEKIAVLEGKKSSLDKEREEFPRDENLREACRMHKECMDKLDGIKRELDRLSLQMAKWREEAREKQLEAAKIAEKYYISCRLDLFQTIREEMEAYREKIYELKSLHHAYRQCSINCRMYEENMEECEQDLDTLRYEQGKIQQKNSKNKAELDSAREQLKLSGYEEKKERLDCCLKRLDEIPGLRDKKIIRKGNCETELKYLHKEKYEYQEKEKAAAEETLLLSHAFLEEYRLGYIEKADNYTADNAGRILKQLESKVESSSNNYLAKFNQEYSENRGYLNEYNLTLETIFDREERSESFDFARVDLVARHRGKKVKFAELVSLLEEEIQELEQLIKQGDKELFEDILANTVSRKIRGRINSSISWVEKMNQLMISMNTSSSLKLSLKWKSKTSENENQLDTRELVELLKKDAKMMTEGEFDALSIHFRSKVAEARRGSRESGNMQSFHMVMKDTLDYRKWFEFQLFSEKAGERKRELTNSVFGTFSGGEKAMAMYVPLFSAVVAKYQGARPHAPRLISLDEAFAGVDNKNIRDMFRLMVEFEFDFIINSQILWGDCDTLDSLAIYHLLRPENAKFVSVMQYRWNGSRKEAIE